MEFELRQLIRILWRWAWLLIASTILAAFISFSATSQMPRIYSATATLMVGQVLQSTNPNAADFSTAQQLAQTYVQLVKRQPLLQATADALALNLPWQVLSGQVSAAALPNTQLLQIAVVDSSPQRARLIADEAAHQLILQSPTPVEKEQEQRQGFIDQQLADLQSHINESQTQIKDLQPQLASETSARGIQDVQNQIGALQQKIATWQTTYASLIASKVGRVNSLSVVEPATGSPAPVSPNVQVNVLGAAVVGFVLALTAVLLIEYLDDTLKTREDVARVLKLQYLGGIGRIPASQPLVALTDSRSPTAEAFRVLRSSIQLALRRERQPRILITSPSPGEGKTTTAANLAVSLAQAGKTVILCDMDLRRPSLHHLFGVANEIGLSELVLEPSLPLDAALVRTAQAGLWLLPSGTVPTNPAELFTSDVITDRLDQLAHHADILLFDSPSVLPMADTQILATFATAVVLVADGRRTRPDAVRHAIASLDQVGVNILGLVLNRTKDPRMERDYYVAREGRRRPDWLRIPSILSAIMGSNR